MMRTAHTSRFSARRLAQQWMLCLLPCLALAAGCGEDDTPVDEPEASIPYDTLSEYGLFQGAMVDRQPAEGMIPYVPVSPLWADHADKGRYIRLPEGTQLEWIDDETWDFPIGTILVKTFLISTDRRDPDGSILPLETRLLIRDDSLVGWSTHTYVWNDDLTDATRQVAGSRITLSITQTDDSVEEQVYLVPNTNQCRDCHGRNDETLPLGVSSVQLDVVMDIDGESTNQVDVMTASGVFATRPPAPTFALTAPTDTDGTLEARARSYLHANCSHCHREGGDAGRTGLDLRAMQDDPARAGVCKTPTAAGAGTGGRFYDIVPGDPDASILPYRMNSTDPAVRMPELPSRLVDNYGVELVVDWIASMEGDGCEE